ncbi:MAG: 3-dehydroquinate synthase [Candidatus Methanodesulfokora sp.]|jgi:3-dehydroquinate synthase
MHLIVERGALKRIEKEISEISPFSVAVVTERRVADLHLEKLMEHVKRAECIVLEQGEKIKSLETAIRLWKWLFEIGATRRTLLLAFGGGTVMDIAGFAASTYMRGMFLANIPTTLLAQADAAIGGKNGIDLMGKNMVGTFYNPKFVLVDTSFLDSLGEDEMRSGMAEVIKHAIIGDERLLEMLERNNFSIEEVVRRSLLVKLRIVSRDPREERGIRSVLNLGHTVGHAIELLSGYSVHHGFAISIGMAVSCRIGEMIHGFDKRERVENLLEKMGLSTRFKADPDDVIRIARRDKKAVNGRIVMAIPKRVGRVVVEEVDEEILRRALEEVIS